LEKERFFESVFGGDTCVFGKPYLNDFMSMGRSVWRSVRTILQDLLSLNNQSLSDNYSLRNSALINQNDIILLLPAKVGDYSDFYSSREHATNLGKILRPDQEPLMPNWLWLPVGYHGRSSSVIISGTPIRRPSGQVKPPTAQVPIFKKSGRLDLELEIAVFVGPGNKIGEPIPIDEAEEHIFGLALLNDWSARDIQAWEYVPLGPFLGKNFATTISPWIVTLEALEPFRCPSPIQDPQPLDYLRDTNPNTTYDINLEYFVNNSKLENPFRLSYSNYKYMYWSMKQQLVHHAISGCNLNPGDIIGSGTISGPGEMMGSLIELTWNGQKPFELPNGEKRTFIEDGDSITLTGWCQGDGYRVGFGICEGTILS